MKTRSRTPAKVLMMRTFGAATGIVLLLLAANYGIHT